MTARIPIHAITTDETCAFTARIVYRAHAASFDLAWGPTDGTDRDVDHNAEPVRWTATVVFPEPRGTVRAHWTAHPGECQRVAAQMVCVELLKLLGVSIGTVGNPRHRTPGGCQCAVDLGVTQ